MAISVPFTGGCACGAIRYECSAEPMFSVNCHCRDCQHATGSAYSAELVVPKDALHLTKSTPTYYVRQSDSDTTIKRGFCAECGSPVLILNTIQPWSVIPAGGLDDPSEFQPQMDIYTSRAHAWDYMNPDLPKYAEMPPVDDL